MGLISKLFGSRRAKLRDEAARLGISVSSVERDRPYFSLDMKSVELKRGAVARYSLPRKNSAPAWELLQRTEADGATFPNNYLLKSNEDCPEALTNELRIQAEEHDEDFYEFEGTSSDVAVYWEEWGGADKAKAIHRILVRLSAW